MGRFFTVFVFSFIAYTISAQQPQVHELSFKNSNGVYGTIVLKTMPITVGYAYLWIQQDLVRIEGVEYNKRHYTADQLEGISFPVICEDCYFKVSGVACINFNGPPYECGYFSSTDVMRGALGKSSPEVKFSQATKDKHNQIHRTQDFNSWEENGLVQSIQVAEVKGATVSNILRKARKNNKDQSNQNKL